MPVTNTARTIAMICAVISAGQTLVHFEMYK
jgi:hypothetical protein